MKNDEIPHETIEQSSKFFRHDLLTSGEHIILETRPFIWPKLIGSAILILIGCICFNFPNLINIKIGMILTKITRLVSSFLIFMVYGFIVNLFFEGAQLPELYILSAPSFYNQFF